MGGSMDVLDDLLRLSQSHEFVYQELECPTSANILSNEYVITSPSQSSSLSSNLDVSADMDGITVAAEHSDSLPEVEMDGANNEDGILDCKKDEVDRYDDADGSVDTLDEDRGQITTTAEMVVEDDRGNDQGTRDVGYGSHSDSTIQVVTLPVTVDNRCFVKFMYQNIFFESLMDSGAQCSVIHIEVLHMLGIYVLNICTRVPVGIDTATGSPMNVLGKIKLVFQLENICAVHDFIVVDNIMDYVIFGTDLLGRGSLDAVLDMGRREITFYGYS